MFVVYDESHNLSEQQAELLESLEPDAYLMASATLNSFPHSFKEDVMNPYMRWAKKEVPSEQNLEITLVDGKDVVEHSLVKKHIHFDGTTASMESCVDELLSQYAYLEQEASYLGVNPKAIYVCDTNMVDDGGRDDPTLSFEARKSPMIRIWRHLVARGVDPTKIAVYSSQLDLDPSSTPADFKVFGKKEDDFYSFQSGNYRHIIFNKSLQEGWDDPECYLGYIDKGMGSKVGIEQIIGRVLRQPLTTHFSNPALNTAQFFVRVDKKETFSAVVDAVKEKLSTGHVPDLLVNSSYSDGFMEKPVKISPRHSPVLGLVNIDTGSAEKEVKELLSTLCTFSDLDAAATGVSEAMTKNIDIQTGELLDKTDWIRSTSPTRKVSLRWLISLRIRELSHQVLNIAETSDKKFDRMVQFNSLIDRRVVEVAKTAVSIYCRNASLDYNSSIEFSFSSSMVRPSKAVRFNHSIFESYSGLNSFELGFAKALDEYSTISPSNNGGEVLWHRNPSITGGFKIPLVDVGNTANYYPDFIVWHNGLVYCLDTKGRHLLEEAVRRKLFDVKDQRTTKLVSRFISKGKQTEENTTPSKDGYTVWRFKNNKEYPVPCDSLDEAVEQCLKED